MPMPGNAKKATIIKDSPSPKTLDGDERRVVVTNIRRNKKN